jgi:hypothetical protein
MKMGTETATVNASAQDISSRVEEALYPTPEGEPETPEVEEVVDGAEELPEVDDSEAEDEDGPDDLEAIATDEELSLGNYLGIDDDKLEVDEESGAIVFNTVIDGEAKQVPLKDIVASYQLQGHVNNKSMAVETDRKEFEEVKQQVATELHQRVQGVTKLAELAEGELVNEYQSIDWDTLRVQDPANWTALRQEYAERAQKVQQVKSLAGEEANRIQEDQKQQFEAKAKEYFMVEHKAMLVDNPTWVDDSIKTVALGEMKSFLANYGFNEEDAQGINDHRLIRLIKDAQAYKGGLKAATEKRVEGKVLPKFQKPGSRSKNSASLSKARAAKAAKGKLKASGSLADTAALLVDRM